MACFASHTSPAPVAQKVPQSSLKASKAMCNTAQQVYPSSHLRGADARGRELSDLCVCQCVQRCRVEGRTYKYEHKTSKRDTNKCDIADRIFNRKLKKIEAKHSTAQHSTAQHSTAQLSKICCIKLQNCVTSVKGY